MLIQHPLPQRKGPAYLSKQLRKMVIQSLIVSDANLLSFVWLTPDGILFSAQLEWLPF